MISPALRLRQVSRKWKIHCSTTSLSDREGLSQSRTEQFAIPPTPNHYRCTENTITASCQLRGFIYLLAAHWIRENSWVLLATLIPSDEIEEVYATQLSPTTGAPAKPAHLAFGALFIKQRLALTDEETVEQIRENPYLQFFLGFASYSTKAPFDPSMMVHFRKAQPSRRVAIFRGRSQSDQQDNVSVQGG
jgi:hypothetical protein